eukprot:3664665-Amphidinium_carterae.1
MDREEFVNMFSNSASAQKPKAPPAPAAPKPPPPAKTPPPGRYVPTTEGQITAAATTEGCASFFILVRGAVWSSISAKFKPPPPMHVKGTAVTRTRPLGETIGTTWSGYYGDLLSDSSDVLTDFEKIMPQRASRLSMFSNQDAYNIPDGHPSSALWPRKENNTKNCFAITSSFSWKAKGPTIKEAQRNLYMSLDGPLTVPINGTPEKLSGYIGSSIEAYDIAKSFDYLLGYTLDHEYELLDIVRQKLENRLANLMNEQLLYEGAAWFGWHTERWENPIHFIPTMLFNSQHHQYVQVTSEESCFADVSWESVLEHLWPIELNYFSLSWKERREVVMEEYSSKNLMVKQMMCYIGLYGITEKGRRAKAQHLGAWALDCMWAEV